jgi:hypothetical protein
MLVVISPCRLLKTGSSAVLQKLLANTIMAARRLKTIMENFTKLFHMDAPGLLHRRNSVLNVAVWLTAVVTPSAFYAAYLLREYPVILYGLLVVGLWPIGLVSYAFLRLLIKDPNLLASEEYRIQARYLEVVAQSGLRIPPFTEPIPNPAIDTGISQPEGEE